MTWNRGVIIKMYSSSYMLFIADILVQQCSVILLFLSTIVAICCNIQPFEGLCTITYPERPYTRHAAGCPRGVVFPHAGTRTRVHL